ncbi:CdaR family transcriptional regulator [Sutcliffiella halmapala]|uniref:CdaR family transcriptional regulator n=1 Tax=Sutcliffiella halmapala TaxID=79882 RepID=UPI000994B720|nr:sugar diacid recognition domain-containing protein [Sutcliffiella halmapala]
MLTQHMATEIVKQTTIRLNRNINIMDERGIIIASGNRKRINQAHFGAMEVLKTGKTLIIHENEPQKWGGSLPGINLPIEFQQQIIGVIGITGNPKEIMDFGELVKMITEMMIQQAFVTEQLEWKQRLKDQIFEDLLKDTIHPKTIEQRLELIDIKLKPPFQVSIMEVGANELKKSDLIQLVEDIFTPNEKLIGSLSVNQLFILTSNLSETNTKQKLVKVLQQLRTKGLSPRIGLGSVVKTELHIRHSYNESISALSLGNNEQPLITYTEVETKALLNQLDERTKHLFCERILGNLSDKLIETLEQLYSSNLNLGECAKKMYIHRNSLVYRIKKIKELTGYNPQELNDAITLQIAIWLKEMARMK